MMLPDRRLLEYLEDEVTGSQRAEIDALLADSPPAQRRLREMEEMIAGLRAADESVDSIDLVASVRSAVEQGPAAAPRRGRRWLPVASGVAVLAAGVVAVVLARGGDRDASSEFRAKSGGEEPADRAVGFDVYVADGEASPRRLIRALPQGAGLLFAYRNESARRHLMIVAVDQRGEVFWFYPAHETAGSDPRSIEIATTAASAVELPDRVEHDLAPGPLAIYALFTDRPETVSSVEAVIASLVRGGGFDARRPPRLPIAGSAQQVLVAEVEAP